MPRRSVPVGVRQESDLVARLEQEGRCQRGCRRQIGPAAATVVLPFALGGRCRIGHHGDTGQRVRRRTAALGVGRIIENRAKNRVHRSTRRITRIFRNTGQSHAGSRAQWRIVDRSNGDHDIFCVALGTTDTGVALIIHGNDQRLLIPRQRIQIGGWGELQGRKCCVDGGLGSGEHHFAVCRTVAGGECQPGQGRQGDCSLGRCAEVERYLHR